MSDIAHAGREGGTPFGALTVMLLLACGIIGFVGMLLLGAYAPDLRSGRNGGAHALSNAATGYSGLVTLARATGRKVTIVRDEKLFGNEDLLVVTSEKGATDISAALSDREDKPTLFVLPKWVTARDEDHPGWVRRVMLQPVSEPVGVLAPGIRFTIQRYPGKGQALVPVYGPEPRFRTPRVIQAITGVTFTSSYSDYEMTPLVVDSHGNTVLAQIGERPLYVLSDPDLIDNLGMKDVAQAQAALAMLARIGGGEGKHVAFDVSYNGFGHARSPLRLAFEPPFVAMTITLAAALALLGWSAFARFGPIAPRTRAIAYGKAALVDNSAALVRKARREPRMGGRYAAAIRDRAARIFGAPARLRDTALDDYLDSLKGPRRFSDLAAALREADDRRGLLAAARALHSWQAEKMEKHK